LEVLERLVNVTLFVATLRTTAPILLVALGGSFTTKAGIFNIGLEGQMLVGAFFAVIGAIFSHSPWIGVLCGVAAAVALAYVFALMVVTFKANEVVVGLALNILASGMTVSLLKAIFGTRGSVFGHGLVGLPIFRIPFANSLGWFGQLISGYTPLVYAAFLLVPILLIFYHRTPLGLHIRVVGEKPDAAEALGLSIPRLRYTASLACGALAGLAGAHLSLGYTTMFTENMSSGRGFMAVAILIFSKGDPFEIALGCLLFGFSDALSLRLQTLGISSYLVLCVPYLVALVALFGLAYRSRPRVISETLASMGRALAVGTNTADAPIARKE
jgi:simple sugar transport system permease protein